MKSTSWDEIFAATRPPRSWRFSTPHRIPPFATNYLDLPFDISKVFFITTANAADTIPRPLLDRMETIRLSGYSDEEKLQIARRYLLPRRLKEAGLGSDQLIVPDETILAVTHRYTRESGVRELERALGRLARKVALRIARATRGTSRSNRPTSSRSSARNGSFWKNARKTLPPGVATGLAWTESGGDVLYIEAVLLPEKRPQRPAHAHTGNSGDVMQESAKAARTTSFSHCLARYRAELGGVHIHVPAGAIPKDRTVPRGSRWRRFGSLYSG